MTPEEFGATAREIAVSDWMADPAYTDDHGRGLIDALADEYGSRLGKRLFVRAQALFEAGYSAPRSRRAECRPLANRWSLPNRSRRGKVRGC